MSVDVSLVNELRAQITALRAQVSALDVKVAQNDAEIDALQIKAQEKERAWYLQVPVLVSVLAALVAILSTGYGIYLQREESRHAAQVELRTLLQRLTDIPKEAAEFQSKYDAQTAQNLLALSAVEYEYTTQQALDIVRSAPDQVSASQYTLLAYALTTNFHFPEAVPLLEYAASRAKNMYEGTSTLRTLGGVHFSMGNLDEGRAAYQKALQLRTKYPGLSAQYYDSMDGLTELVWAGSELGQQQCQAARTHADRAQEIVNRLPPGSASRIDGDTKIAQLHQALAACK